MLGVSPSVNLPLHHKVQKFSFGTGSLRWSRKKGHKTVVVWFMLRIREYGDVAGKTVEESSSLFCLIQMHQLPLARACGL